MKARALIPAGLALSSLTLLSPVGTASAEKCAAANCRPDRLGGVGGKAAIDRLGSQLPAVAVAHGWSADQLRRELAKDPSLRVAGQGDLYYAEEVAEGDALAVATTTEALPVDPVADVFALHSRPGAALKIYLDVDGHTTAGTTWNSTYGASIVSAPFDLDGSPSTFNQTERDRLQRWWLQVAEDFAPWNVDVTTQDPGVEALRKTSKTDGVYGLRVVISPTNWYGSAGGVARVGSFTASTDTPAFAFTNSLGNGDVKAVAEAITHETGHTLGLGHDGTSTTGYHKGNSTWAPIMGIAYYVPVTQWSRGSYPDANNREDDVAVISSRLPLRSDEAGSDLAGSMKVAGDASLMGTIGAAADVDLFAVDVPAGVLSATVRPSVGADLDPQLQLLDANGSSIAVSDAPGPEATSITKAVPAGRYYWRIDGVGLGDPAWGYDDYGSLGRYQLVSVIDAPSAPASTKSAPVASVTAFPVSPRAGEPVGFSSGYSFDPDGGSIQQVSWSFGGASPASDGTAIAVRTYATPGRYPVILTVVDDDGVSSSSMVTITVRPADAPTSGTNTVTTGTTTTTTTTTTNKRTRG